MTYNLDQSTTGIITLASTVATDPNVTLDANNAAGSMELQMSGTDRIKLDATGIGFFNGTPVAKPTITGARDANPALADVLTDLASMGLVTDSSTVGVSGSGLPSGYLDGLRLQWNSVTQVQFTAGTCRDSTNEFDLTLAITTTITMEATGSGATGLQTGSSEASDTFYKCLIIGDTNGVNATTTLLVPQGTAFSETGYDVFRFLGSVRNNGSDDFLRFILHRTDRNRHMMIEEPKSELIFLNTGGPDSSDTFETVSMSDVVPENTSMVDIQVEFDMDNDGHTLYLQSGINPQTVANCPRAISNGVETGTFDELNLLVSNLTIHPAGSSSLPSLEWAASSGGNSTQLTLISYFVNL